MNFIPDIRPALLTKRLLDEMAPDTVFAYGYMEHLHPWFNDLKKNYELRTLEATILRHMIEQIPNVELRGSAYKQIETPKSRYRLVKWVAHRGGIHDWCIYHSMDASLCPHDYFDCDCHLLASWEKIMRSGAKLTDFGGEIRRFVPCDPEAFNLYRQ